MSLQGAQCHTALMVLISASGGGLVALQTAGPCLEGLRAAEGQAAQVLVPHQLLLLPRRLASPLGPLGPCLPGGAIVQHAAKHVIHLVPLGHVKG